MTLLSPRGQRWKCILLYASIAIVTNFLEGYSSAYPNTAGDTFQNFINGSYVRRGDTPGLTEWEYTWFWSLFLNVWFIGYIIGTFLTPYFTDTFGRWKSLMVANFVSFLGTVVSTLSVILLLPELLFLGRIIAAAASGVSFGALILFLQETSPTRLRGLCSFLSEAAFLASMVLGMGLGMDIALGRHLIYLLGFGLIPGLLGVLIMFPLKETPKYLLMHEEDRDKASKALKYYQGEHIDTNGMLDEMLKESLINRMDLSFKDALMEVFYQPHLRKAALVGIFSLQLCAGIWPIDYVSTDLLEAHFSPSVAQIFSFVFVSANFLSSLVGMCFIEKVGRRPMLLWCGIANTFCLIGYVVFDRLAVYANSEFRYGCIGALVGYGVTYGTALGPIAFFITSELVPQRFRSLVQSIVFAVNTMSNFFFSFATLPMYRWINIWALIPLFIIPSTISLIYLYLEMPETRGREIYEIVKELANKSTLSSATVLVLSDNTPKKSESSSSDTISTDFEAGELRPFEANIMLNASLDVTQPKA